MRKNKTRVFILLFVYLILSFLTIDILPLIFDELGYIIIIMPVILAASSIICGVGFSIMDEWEKLWLMPFLPIACMLVWQLGTVFSDGLSGTLFFAALYMSVIIYIITFFPAFIGGLLCGWLKGICEK